MATKRLTASHWWQIILQIIYTTPRTRPNAQTKQKCKAKQTETENVSSRLSKPWNSLSEAIPETPYLFLRSLCCLGLSVASDGRLSPAPPTSSPFLRRPASMLGWLLTYKVVRASFFVFWVLFLMWKIPWNKKVSSVRSFRIGIYSSLLRALQPRGGGVNISETAGKGMRK